LSTSEPTEFDGWIAEEFARRGDFTALVVLLAIDELKVRPLCSTYFAVIGTEIDWPEIVLLFAGAGMPWDGAAFFPVGGTDGRPLDNPTARLKLRELENRLEEDRLVLNEGHFFNRDGRRLQIEEVPLQ
jgi:hypothetical protein